MELMADVEGLLKEIESDPTVNSAVIISGKPGNFIAGADITMLQAIQDEESGYQIVMVTSAKSYDSIDCFLLFFSFAIKGISAAINTRDRYEEIRYTNNPPLSCVFSFSRG